MLDTEAVIRESCGCGSSLHTFRKSQFPMVEGGLEASFARGRERIVAEITALIEGVWRGGTPDKLLTALVHDLRVPAAGEFLSTLEDILRSPGVGQVEVWAWQRVIAHLRLRVLPWIASDPLLVSRAENLWLSASVQVGDQACREEARKRVLSERRSRTLAHFCQALIGATDMDELAEVVGAGFPHLGVPCCWLSLYDDPAAPLGSSHLALSCDKDRRVKFAPESADFRVAPALSRRQHLFWATVHVGVCALCPSERASSGFVLFGVGSGGGQCVRRSPPAIEQRDHAVKREEELARLYVAQQERSRELEEAYRATKRTTTAAYLGQDGRARPADGGHG